MDRLRKAIIIPLVVLPAGAVVAIGIGWLLHAVPHGWAPPTALALTVLVTAGAFIVSARQPSVD